MTSHFSSDIRYLAIDAATSSGWALVEGQRRGPVRVVEYGTLRLHQRAAIQEQIRAMLGRLSVRPDVLAVESPVPVYERGKLRNHAGYATAVGISAIWRDTLRAYYGIVPEEVYPSAWQASVLRGLSGDTKRRAAAAVAEIYGLRDVQHDAADALCIAYWCHTRHGWLLEVSDDDKRAGVKRALNTYFLRRGGAVGIDARR